MRPTKLSSIAVVALVATLMVVACAVPAQAQLGIQVQIGPGYNSQGPLQPVVVQWSDGTTSVAWVPAPQPQIVVPVRPQWQQPWGCQPPPPPCWGGPPPPFFDAPRRGGSHGGGHHDGGGRIRSGGPSRHPR